MLKAQALNRCSSGIQHHRSPIISRPNVRACSGLDALHPNGANQGLANGTKVKVVKPIKVFHVPKVKEVNLEGLEGEVQRNATQYKGKVLSANLPYVVKFSKEIEGKAVNFMAHLADDEIQTL